MSAPDRRRWTSEEDKELKVMLDAGKFAPEIALKLNRTPQAIYARLQRLYRERTETSRDLGLKAAGRTGAQGSQMKPYPTYRQREVLQCLMNGDWMPLLKLIPIG